MSPDDSMSDPDVPPDETGKDERRDESKPGISNLIGIMAVATGRGEDEVEAEFSEAGYGDFKKAVGEAVVEYLRPVREAYPGIRSDEAELDRILAGGAERARTIASGTLADARRAMGIGSP